LVFCERTNRVSLKQTREGRIGRSRYWVTVLGLMEQHKS
jgi:uncharacterized membrane protein YhaH (DUF805 family)